MMVSIEQHVDWVADCLDHLRRLGLATIEPTEAAETGWVQHVNDCADITLYPAANSWYMGANVPGKPRVFLPYVGGVDSYRAACDEVVNNDYLGFRMTGPGGTQCCDGVVRRLQPDVAAVLELIESLNLPLLESLSAEDARMFSVASAAARPPGPDVGEIVDGILPGPAVISTTASIDRPATARTRSSSTSTVVAGCSGATTPTTRSAATCASDPTPSSCPSTTATPRSTASPPPSTTASPRRSGSPTTPSSSAVCRVSSRSAGGAPVATSPPLCATGARCRWAADPRQVLLTPVTDSDLSRGSYVDNGDGHMLTTALMQWFWDHYADPSERGNPTASPLRAADLSELPPALVVTCEFDPLRDEGAAYADALAAAGVPVRHLSARGHIHTSVPMVDVIISGAGVRAEMADALRQFLTAPVSA